MVLLWDCRSLVNKLTNFQSFADSSSYRVFALTLKRGCPLPSLMEKYYLLGRRFTDMIKFLVVEVSCWLSTTLSLPVNSIPLLI